MEFHQIIEAFLACASGDCRNFGSIADLLANALVAGLLLGGFYAAVTIGVTISFGMLDIVNIAHPAFIMLGSFTAYFINQNFGVDPVVVGIVFPPAFFLL